MAAELKDVRLKVSIEAYCALRAEAQAKGAELAEIAREVFEQWASEKIRAATLMNRLLKSEGIRRIEEGK